VCGNQREYFFQQTTINRKKQSRGTLPDELKKLEDEMNAMKKKLEMHREEAKEAHEYYQKVVKQCSKD